MLGLGIAMGGMSAALMRRSGDTPVTPVDLSIGALTLTGAGGVATTAADGTYGPYTVAGGVLTPNSSPVTPGTYDVGGVMVQAVASEYSVASSAEYDAALADVPGAGGRTIRFRAATYDWGSKTLANNKNFAAPLVVTAEAGAVFSDGLSISSSSNNITLRGLRVIWDGANPEVFNTEISISGTNIVVEDCEISGIVYDPLGTPEDNNSFYNVSRAISVTSGGGITIRRNKIYNVEEGIVVLANAAGGISITDNEISHTYSDTIKINPTGAAMTAGIEVERNVLHSFIGDPTDARNPHIDLCQFLSSAGNDDQYVTGVVVRQNVAWMDYGTRSRIIQGITAFEDSGYRLILQDPIIAGNMLAISGPHHITLRVDGGVFANNTLVNPSQDWPTPGNARIFVDDSTGNVLIKNNVTDLDALISGTATVGQADNTELGVQGATIPYATEFVGPTFPASDFTDAKAKFAVQSGTAGAIGSGYGTYGAALTSTGWTYDPTCEAEPVASAPEAFVVGDWALNDTGAGGTLGVTITELPFSNWSAITDIKYRVNGGSAVSTGGVVSFEISGLTDDVEYDVEIWAVNAEGEGLPSDTKSATSTNAGYLINAVSVPSAAMMEHSVFAVPAMSAFAIDFWVRFPGTYPTSGSTITFQNAGGTGQILINQASSGRMSFFSGGLATAYTLPTSTLAADTWHHIQWSVDTRAGQRLAVLYVNGVSRPITSAVADDTLTQAIGRVRVSDLSANIELADVYALLGDSIDFSDPAERAKFAADADKGADGSTPTGTAPALFLSGATGSWHVNKGTGGGLTLSGGSLTTAGSVPS